MRALWSTRYSSKQNRFSSKVPDIGAVASRQFDADVLQLATSRVAAYRVDAS
jgi:hypothetical protein